MFILTKGISREPPPVEEVMQFYAVTTFPPAILSKLIQLLQAADLAGKPN